MSEPKFKVGDRVLWFNGIETALGWIVPTIANIDTMVESGVIANDGYIRLIGNGHIVHAPTETPVNLTAGQPVESEAERIMREALEVVERCDDAFLENTAAEALARVKALKEGK